MLLTDGIIKQAKENFTCSTRNCACRNSVSSVKEGQFTGGTDVCSKKGIGQKLKYSLKW